DQNLLEHLVAYDLWAGSSPAIWHAELDVTIASIANWAAGNLSPRKAASAGIGLKAAAGVGMRDRLHQLANLRFQEIVGDHQRAARRPTLAPAGGAGLTDGRFQLAFVVGVGLRTG